jgi:prepilin peptidase CpaA
MVLDLIPAAVASLAAVLDVRWRRIPNWLVVAALGAGLAANAWRTGPGGLLVALAGAGLGLALLLPFYAVRAIGAGDVKLLAALGALVGPHTLISVALYAAVVGGLISCCMLARRGRLGLTLREIGLRPARLSRSGARAPYGVAIASGVYLSMVLPSVIG